MARYDLEALLSDLKGICVNNLNTKLSEITTEKGDSLPLPTILSPSGSDPGAYFFQRIETSRANVYKAFLFYSVEDPTADGIGPHTLEGYQVNFIVVLKDTIDGDLFSTRLLRYSRALKEIFETAFTQNKIRARIQVSSLSPQAFAIEGIPTVFRGVGVQVRTVIG